MSWCFQAVVVLGMVFSFLFEPISRLIYVTSLIHNLKKIYLLGKKVYFCAQFEESSAVETVETNKF